MADANFKTLRIHRNIVLQLEEHKKKTGVPVSTFVGKAVEEKLKRIKSKKKS